ncbi:MAG TPA: xanthine dehydrogenase accessory protein XdhC [Anaeromyxobacter sp.]|nr:xanthine dehydrogenase accessory protein XdhC [Anaeromyxobacter sp.]
MTAGWIAALAELEAAGQPAVLATVVSVAGSTPRGVGAKMVVTALGLFGSIGGGHLELEVLTQARALLARAAAGEDVSAPVVRELLLGPSLGQCCGGRTTILLETIVPVPWQVAVFGAGHVGKALVKLLAEMPCAVTWIDPRPEELPTAPPERVRCVVSEAPADEVAELKAGADLVVLTHSHALDLEIVDAAMKRGTHRYLGLIGSRTKRAQFEKRLEARGRTKEQLAGLVCPIGIEGIVGKEPAVIAIAVAAELLRIEGVRRPLHSPAAVEEAV